MSPALIKILIIVTLVHFIGFNVVLIGFTAPKPTPKASFYYDESRAPEVRDVKVSGGHPSSLILLPNKTLPNDASWKILLKDKENVRVGL